MNRYAPAWLAIPRPRRRSWLKEIQQMFRKDKLNAVKPDAGKRPDPALAAVAFRDQLIRLITEAEANHVRFHVLVDTLEAQVTRLRINAASRPW